ncbi:DUF1634 domain-containing protein [Chitinophaga parva]|uniref:DUF1634 domain-containing protein n=1 Tax=Chitinophaga parva TaxID=2169414 RepID=A0A2T7BE03_9BACT|nr:DUF1634 domain-containing protein [Chitinophaga parva]PUZ23307.1 DUF1634 domain-containing protein [Chitinophaga parva]
MEKKNRSWKDTDVEQLVGQLLRYGVLTACLVAFIGGVCYLMMKGNLPVPAYNVFKGETNGYTTYSGIFHGAVTGSSPEIIQLGALLLIATPILRVAFSLVGFVLEKDKLYIGITLLVLLVMMTSIFGGLKG